MFKTIDLAFCKVFFYNNNYNFINTYQPLNYGEWINEKTNIYSADYYQCI